MVSVHLRPGPGLHVWWLLSGGQTERGGGEAGGVVRTLMHLPGESFLRGSAGLMMGCRGWRELGLCDKVVLLR